MYLIAAEYCFVEMIRSDQRKWMGKRDTLQRFAVLPFCRFAVLQCIRLPQIPEMSDSLAPSRLMHALGQL